MQPLSSLASLSASSISPTEDILISRLTARRTRQIIWFIRFAKSRSCVQGGGLYDMAPLYTCLPGGICTIRFLHNMAQRQMQGLDRDLCDTVLAQHVISGKKTGPTVSRS